MPAKNKAAFQLQDFQCPETKKSSLKKPCKAAKSEIKMVSKGVARLLCACGMPFRAKVS